MTGKVGTDIEENKCSWLVVQALDRVTPEQREVLQVRKGGASVFFFQVNAPSNTITGPTVYKMVTVAKVVLCMFNMI